MQTRSPTFRRLFAPIVFALACVALTIYLWQSFGGALPLTAKRYQVTVTMPDATSIFADSDVQVAGVKVGDVEAVRRDGNDAVVTLELDAPYVPLREGTSAIARTKTLLGEGYVELGLGPKTAPPVRDGGSLARADVVPTQRLEDVLDTFRPETRKDFASMFTGLAKALDGRSQDLNDTLAVAPPATASLRSLAVTLDAQRPELQQMIANSGDVLSAIGEREGVAQAAIIAGDELLETTAQRNVALSATVRALPPFLADLRDLSTTLGGASTDITTAVSALEPVAPDLRGGLAAINVAAPEFRGVFSELPGVFEAGRQGLPALESILETFRTQAPPIYMAAREFIPFLELLALNRDSAVGFFANIAQLSNISFIGPGGKSLRGVNGVPSLWNETLAGFVKKLGTNRQNSYVKPKGQLRIADSGGLLAYDCRNADNPTPIPATGGNGAVRCKEQGPWLFRGERRYFPQLTIDGP